MHPILFDKPLNKILPPHVIKNWIPVLAAKWQLWVGLLIVSVAIAWWGMAPEATKGRRTMGWLGTLASLVFLLCLSAIGLKNPQFTVQLHTYGVLVAIGFLLGIILAVREAKKEGIGAEKILDLSFWVLIMAMVGARASHVFIHWADFKTDWAQTKGAWYTAKVFRLWEGGLLYYGGFFLALVVCWLFVKANKMNFMKLADAIVPAVVIGQFFGQIGNLAAGFSYGKDAPGIAWAIEYSHKNAAALKGSPLHPTQTYLAVGLLLLFFLLMWRKSEKQFHGQVFLYYLLLYPALDFFVGVFQGDPKRGMLLQKDVFSFSPGIDVLSWSQGISLIVFAFALFLLMTKSSQSEATNS